jgi:AcrR family transcriptional regulator
MDIRQYSTNNRIIAGLIACMNEKPFRTLTNKEIIDKAEVSPRTFYRYYKDKNELLDRLEEQILQGLADALADDRKVLENLQHSPDKKDIIDLADPAFKETLAYAEKHKDIGRALLSENGDIKFARQVVKVSENEFRARAKYLSGDQNIKVDDEIFVNMYVSQIINVIEDWLFFSDNVSPSTIRKIIGEIQVMSPFEMLKMMTTEQENSQHGTTSA